MRYERNCPEGWIIQAYIDGELDSEQVEEFNNHIAVCASCAKRVEERKKIVAAVLEEVELLEKNPLPINRKRQLVYRVLLGMAATVMIIVGIFSLMPLLEVEQEVLLTETCEWIAVDAVNFQPELESPNRLYQMRVIAISEVDVDGNEDKYYLVKQCKNHNKSN